MRFRIIFIFLLTSSFSLYSQTKTTDKKELTYFYVGDGCPFCNTDHPEKVYGFIIECVGCIMTPEIKKNNNKVIQTIDKKRGQGWTGKYIKTYCDNVPNK